MRAAGCACARKCRDTEPRNHGRRSTNPPAFYHANLAFLLLGPLLLLATYADAKECVSYTTDLAFPGGSPGSVLSTLLVADEVGPAVGAVEVRDLALKHDRVGALLIALYWLPYSEAPANLPLTSHDLAAASAARAVLKDLHQGQGARVVRRLNFSDAANATLGVAQPSLPELSGAYRPATPLSAFSSAQLSSRARWVLRVADLGENWQDRSLELDSWTLVLCPPANSSLPPLMSISMAQQAARDINIFRGAARGAGSAARLTALSGAPIAPAVGTLLTIVTNTQYSTYSDLADQVVAGVIRGIDNIQKLFNLPYAPPPLINVWLPWVELLIGGSEFIFQNFVWPGKIVSYALQLEVAVRTHAADKAKARAAASASANSTASSAAAASTSGAMPAGGGGNSAAGAPTSGTTVAAAAPAGSAGATTAGSASAGAGSAAGGGSNSAAGAPTSGSTSGSTTSGGRNGGSSGGSGGGSSGSGGKDKGFKDAAGADAASEVEGEEVCSNDESVYNRNNPKSLMYGPQGPAEVDTQQLFDDICMTNVPGASWLFSRVPDAAVVPISSNSSGSFSNSNSSSPGLETLTLSSTPSPMSWFPTTATPMRPLDFNRAALPGEGSTAAQQLYQRAQNALRAAVPRPGEPYPDPAFLDGVMNQLLEDISIESYNKELVGGLQRMIDQADAAVTLLDSAARSDALFRAGGQSATHTAEALKAGAETYSTVLKAGRDSLKRISFPEMMNKTRNYFNQLKQNSTLTAAERRFAERFIWNLNTIRLIFRFAATDGPVVSFQQFLYQLSDVNSIRNNAQTLAKMDQAMSGKNSSSSSSQDNKGDKKGNNDKENNKGLGGSKNQQGGSANNNSKGGSFKGSAAAAADGSGSGGREDLATPLLDPIPELSLPDLIPLDDETGASSAGEEVRFDTGETPEEWLARVVAESEATARTALQRIPMDRSTGLDRIIA